ncbi:hypothetical protein N865_06950 [Intrasporangium oryzae NRRL B-24470]|uniref:Uncharacterized protein n=1 Tax=Intrasporangium oryzae NRRL B-24470 TaxID=1386089 RepID=W9GE16_9MICO|nr:hypothetical protein [Intrasporangium oryzae]EWT02099.1 hypothetical protein N865_06950 [Intrasporangium oryzae NRRL B-24470]
MNLSDLRDELTTRADGLAPARDLRAGVVARVRATKQRRAAVAGSVATLMVAALAVGAVSSLDRPVVRTPAGTPSSPAPMVGDDGMPYRVIPDSPGDVVKDGLRYRRQVADDRLAVGFIGDRGQGQFSLLWEPTTTHVSLGAECYLPGLTNAEAAKYLVTVGLEGKKGFLANQCSGRRPAERDLPAGGAVPGEPGRGWTELAVGRSARLRVQLVDAETQRPASVDSAQLTGVVYELGAQTRIVDASGTTVASLPKVIEHQGYPYRFLAMEAAPADRNPMPSLETPARVPFMVTAGVTGSDASSHPGTVYVTGLDQKSGATSGGWQTLPQPARAAGRVGLQSEGAAPLGTAFVATYVLDTSPTP